jgi:organic radical activating enzyme
MKKLKSLFWITLREFSKTGNIFSKGARCTLVTTSKCPFHCEYCPAFIYGSPQQYEESTFDEWRVFLDRIPFWLKVVYISGGEPSLYGDIVPLINYLIERGHHVILQTNLYKPEAYIGIKPHWRLMFAATYHEAQENRLGRGNQFFTNAEFLREHGFWVRTQQFMTYDKRTNRVKEFFTEKWFKETDNSIMLEPSAPRTLRMWLGCVNMYNKNL